MEDVPFSPVQPDLPITKDAKRTSWKRVAQFKGFALHARERPGESRIPDKNAVYMRQYERKPKLFDAAFTSLQNFIASRQRLDIKYQPREHYAKEQVCLVAFEVHNRVKKKILGYLDIREVIANMAELYDYCCKGSPYVAATSLAKWLGQLVKCVEEIAGLIESESGEKVTDWCSVAAHYKKLHTKTKAEPTFEEILPTIGAFQTLKILGEGGFGTVAKCLYGGKVSLCVKVILLSRQSEPRYICTEKVVASMVNYPLICKYYCCFEATEAFVSVMEYLKGIDIWRACHQASLEVQQRRIIMAQLGLAVIHFHLKGFIHRDIKTTNIMMLPNCHVRLIDFDTTKIGMGKFSRSPLRNFYRKTTCEFNDRETAGTRTYQPPECMSRIIYGRSIDWWAVGVTLYEMATGKVPFKGKNDLELKMKINTQAVEYPAGKRLSPDEEDLIQRLLEKDSLQRMCSRDYCELMEHIYFDGIDWRQVQLGKVSEKWEHWDKLMEKLHDGQFSPKQETLDPETLKGIYKVEQLTPASSYTPLYTFAATAFVKASNMLKSGRSISPSDIIDEPELLSDDVLVEYKFKQFLK